MGNALLRESRSIRKTDADCIFKATVVKQIAAGEPISVKPIDYVGKIDDLHFTLGKLMGILINASTRTLGTDSPPDCEIWR